MQHPGISPAPQIRCQWYRTTDAHVREWREIPALLFRDVLTLGASAVTITLARRIPVKLVRRSLSLVS